MNSSQELSKKRTRTHDEDDLEGNLNLSSDQMCLDLSRDERCHDLSWNQNEWFISGKTRKLSHIEIPSSDSPLASPLSSFNLNLNSGSWIINDLTSEEVNGNISFICDGQRSSQFSNQDDVGSIDDKLKTSTTDTHFNKVNHSPATESQVYDDNHSPATESQVYDDNHSPAVESLLNKVNNSPEVESQIIDNKILQPHLSAGSKLSSVLNGCKFERHICNVKSDDGNSDKIDSDKQIIREQTEDVNKDNVQPEKDKNSESTVQSGYLIDQSYEANTVQSGYLIDQSYEANTDLTEYTKCKKNPGHETFLGMDDLRVHHLPLEIQHEDSLTFINCASHLVVQISVFHTSPARGSQDIYSRYIGTNRKRNGSGFISSVDSQIFKFRCKQDTCPLKQCGPQARLAQYSRSFSSPEGAEKKDYNKHYYYSGIYVHTNKHVIFDMSEAERAVVKFFFNSPDETKVVYGHVAAIVGVNNSQDHVTVHVMSHDLNLFHTVNCLLKDARSSYRQMVSSTHKSQASHGLKHSHSWVAVIGHAHGMSKSITFGHVRKEEEDGSRIIKYYDAATCPGSSGGLVMTPSLLKLQWPGAVHSASDPDTGLNVTLDSRVHDLNNQEIGRIHEKLTRSNSESSFPSIE